MVVLDSDDAAEDGSIDNYAAVSDEDAESGLLEAGVRTCVTESGTKEVEEVQKYVKYASI